MYITFLAYYQCIKNILLRYFLISMSFIWSTETKKYIIVMEGKSPGPYEPQSGQRTSNSGQRASNSDQRVSQSNQKVSGRCEMLSGRCEMLSGCFEARRLPGFFPPCLLYFKRTVVIFVLLENVRPLKVTGHSKIIFVGFPLQVQDFFLLYNMHL